MTVLAWLTLAMTQTAALTPVNMKRTALDQGLSTVPNNKEEFTYTGRRKFLAQSVATFTVSTLPFVSNAAENEKADDKLIPAPATASTSSPPAGKPTTETNTAPAATTSPALADSSAKSTTTESKTPAPQETTKPASSSDPVAGETKEKQPEKETETKTNTPAQPEQQAKTTKAEAEALIEKEEKDIIAEIKIDEKDEKKATEDTNKLIDELEKQIKEEKTTDTSKPLPEKEIKQSSTTKDLIDKLEKEEEKLENETKEMIEKIEILEESFKVEEKAAAAASKETPQKQSVEASKTSEIPAKEGLKSTAASTTTSAPQETQEILDKLKERVEEKEDIIARLKDQSQKDVDPKTGKFKPMSSKEFKARAPADFDFLQYLRKTLIDTQEFEQDLGAFRGLLESRLGIKF